MVAQGLTLPKGLNSNRFKIVSKVKTRELLKESGYLRVLIEGFGTDVICRSYLYRYETSHVVILDHFNGLVCDRRSDIPAQS
jgi:hypothetical protein